MKYTLSHSGYEHPLDADGIPYCSPMQVQQVRTFDMPQRVCKRCLRAMRARGVPRSADAAAAGQGRRELRPVPARGDRTEDGGAGGTGDADEIGADRRVRTTGGLASGMAESGEDEKKAARLHTARQLG